MNFLRDRITSASLFYTLKIRPKRDVPSGRNFIMHSLYILVMFPLILLSIVLFFCFQNLCLLFSHLLFVQLEVLLQALLFFFHRFVKCANPKCITNNEPMATLFHVIDKDNCVIKCHYCEKEQKREDITII